MLEERSAGSQAFMRYVHATAAQRHRDSAALADIPRVMDGVARAFPLAHDLRVMPIDCDGRYRVPSVDCRLAPAHPSPAALDDSPANDRRLLAQGIPCARIVMVAESAGVGLAIAARMRCHALGLPMPAASVPISPWVHMVVGKGNPT